MRPTPLFLALGLCGLAVLRAHPPATDMLDAAQSFLHALSPEQRAKATYALTDKERVNWNFVPMARSGLPLKARDEHQRELATGLLR